MRERERERERELYDEMKMDSKQENNNFTQKVNALIHMYWRRNVYLNMLSPRGWKIFIPTPNCNALEL